MQTKIALFTGGDDPNYAIPLLSALTAHGIFVDFIGNDEMRSATAEVSNTNFTYHNLRGDQKETAPLIHKLIRITKYYLNIFKYSLYTESKIFHILWLNRFFYFDRIFCTLYYKALKKRIVFTAHNVNQAERDGKDNAINRLTLRFMYKTVDHILVHSEKMKSQLTSDFKTDPGKITVHSFGLNDFIPDTGMTRTEARTKLGIDDDDRIALFFGRIEPYKGLEYLLLAAGQITKIDRNFRLIIAGKVQNGSESYWENNLNIVNNENLRDTILLYDHFIPDEELEVFFKAADVLVLPYRHIFQSGPLFTSYKFGLPVIATDVGSFREDIIEGKTGYICTPEDEADLARTISKYFKSDLYLNLESNRKNIISYARERYSWANNAKIIADTYRHLIGTL
jgi:D-inositol-3-phosphate glycosyltransferase